MADGVTRGYLAELLAVDVRSIKNFVDEGMPKLARGRYDLRDCVQWYLTREREAARGGKGLSDLDLAKQRKELAMAAKAEIEVEQLRGEILPLDVHESRVEVIAARLATRIKGLGRYIADVQRATTAVEASALLDRISDDLLVHCSSVADDITEDDEPRDRDSHAA